MKRKKFFFLPVFTLIVASLACNTELPQMQATATSMPSQLPTVALTIESGQGNIPLSEAGVPRITVEDAKAALDAGEAVIVDVRSADAYAAGHVEGAINILLGVFETDIANIPLEKDQWIITYCT